jgi:hypothetical protein
MSLKTEEEFAQIMFPETLHFQDTKSKRIIFFNVCLWTYMCYIHKQVSVFMFGHVCVKKILKTSENQNRRCVVQVWLQQ